MNNIFNNLIKEKKKLVHWFIPKINIKYKNN